jgi:molybdopterin molybdotransferase
VSVGPHDHVKGALEALGVQERFWGVALRPGKPTWFGARDSVLAFGLPGNPVSSMVTFHLFVRPALVALQGAPFAAGPHRVARLTAGVPRTPGRDEAVRVRLSPAADGVLEATPTGPQGSHVLTSMVGADGLALVLAGDGDVPPGTIVDVELL